MAGTEPKFFILFQAGPKFQFAFRAGQDSDLNFNFFFGPGLKNPTCANLYAPHIISEPLPCCLLKIVVLCEYRTNNMPNHRGHLNLTSFHHRIEHSAIHLSNSYDFEPTEHERLYTIMSSLVYATVFKYALW